MAHGPAIGHGRLGGILATGLAGCLGGEPSPAAHPPPAPSTIDVALGPQPPTSAPVDGLEVETEATAPTAASGTLTIRILNEGDRTFRTGRDRWRLYKHVDGAWRYLTPRVFTFGRSWTDVRPGEVFTVEFPWDTTTSER